MNTTNERSLIAFEQYGDKKILHINGSLKQAKAKLKRMTGITKIEQEKTYSTCGFLRTGWWQITDFENRYFI